MKYSFDNKLSVDINRSKTGLYDRIVICFLNICLSGAFRSQSKQNLQLTRFKGKRTGIE